MKRGQAEILCYDELWKTVIEKLFREFLCLFLPELGEMVAFTRGYDFLDKELQRISLRMRRGKKFVDKLVKVYLKDGKEKWILLHIEVQGQNRVDFNERMFVYFYRILDKYSVKIASIAVITYPTNSTFEYRYEFFNTRVLYQYNVAKIEDMKEDGLLKINNPFALVCLAVKYSNLSQNDKDLRYNFKRNLIRLMYERKYKRDEIITLFEFIDGILELNNKELDIKIREEIEQIEEGGKMSYVTSIERIGREEGIKEGIKEAALKLIKKGMDMKEVGKLLDIPLEKIKEWIKAVP